MMIDASESQIFVRSRTQRLDETLACFRGIEIAARDSFEEILELFV